MAASFDDPMYFGGVLFCDFAQFLVSGCGPMHRREERREDFTFDRRAYTKCVVQQWLSSFTLQSNSTETSSRLHFPDRSRRMPHKNISPRKSSRHIGRSLSFHGIYQNILSSIQGFLELGKPAWGEWAHRGCPLLDDGHCSFVYRAQSANKHDTAECAQWSFQGQGFKMC